jgi:hypothetical protein
MLDKDLNSSFIGLGLSPSFSKSQGLELYPTLHEKFPILTVAGLKNFGLAKREGGRGAITKGREWLTCFISLLLFALQLSFLSFSLLMPYGKHALYNIHVVSKEKIIKVHPHLGFRYSSVELSSTMLPI